MASLTSTQTARLTIPQKVQKYLGKKAKKNVVQNIFGPKNIKVKISFVLKKCWSTKIKAAKKIGSQKFGQNWVSYS